MQNPVDEAAENLNGLNCQNTFQWLSSEIHQTCFSLNRQGGHAQHHPDSWLNELLRLKTQNQKVLRTIEKWQTVIRMPFRNYCG